MHWASAALCHLPSPSLRPVPFPSLLSPSARSKKSHPTPTKVALCPAQGPGPGTSPVAGTQLLPRLLLPQVTSSRAHKLEQQCSPLYLQINKPQLGMPTPLLREYPAPQPSTRNTNTGSSVGLQLHNPQLETPTQAPPWASNSTTHKLEQCSPHISSSTTHN